MEFAFEVKDIVIMVLLVAIVVQSVATRNLIPPTIVYSFLEFAKAKAAETPTTTDDDIVKAAETIIKDGLLPPPPADAA